MICWWRPLALMTTPTRPSGPPRGGAVEGPLAVAAGEADHGFGEAQRAVEGEPGGDDGFVAQGVDALDHRGQRGQRAHQPAHVVGRGGDDDVVVALAARVAVEQQGVAVAGDGLDGFAAAHGVAAHGEPAGGGHREELGEVDPRDEQV